MSSSWRRSPCCWPPPWPARSARAGGRGGPRRRPARRVPGAARLAHDRHGRHLHPRGEEHGVDPVFLVAIAGAETSFGEFLYSEDGDQCTYNAFNWFYGPTWPTSDFTSWDEAIARVAEGLGGPLYYGSGLYSVDAIAPKYCPDGTEQWVANVKAFMSELGGDFTDTRIAAVARHAAQPDAAVR